MGKKKTFSDIFSEKSHLVAPMGKETNHIIEDIELIERMMSK